MKTIFHDDEGIYYYKEEGGEKIYCPEVIVGITPEGEWLSNILPLPGFDLDQSGNVKKADEAEALYICMQIAQFYKEDIFIKEIKELSNNYNFKDMVPYSGYKTFRMTLNGWMSEFPSNNMKILISACRFRISERKKNSDSFLKDGLQDRTIVGLRNLEQAIKVINFRYLTFVNKALKICWIELIRTDKKIVVIQQTLFKNGNF